MGVNAHIAVVWDGSGNRFTGHNPSGITITIDGDGEAGTSPMMLLLHAEAGCTGIDVVSMLQTLRQDIVQVSPHTTVVRAPECFRSWGGAPRTAPGKTWLPAPRVVWPMTTAWAWSTQPGPIFTGPSTTA